jgi:hypothetical protein
MISTGRMLLFLLGCIGTRLLFVYLSYIASPEILKVYGYLAFLPAVSFSLIYLFGLRRTGGEVFGEPIWWDNLRPVHALLYGLYGASSIGGWSGSWTLLLADVIIGLVSWIYYRMVG